jgi:hypothetical protein
VGAFVLGTVVASLLFERLLSFKIVLIGTDYFLLLLPLEYLVIDIIDTLNILGELLDLR